MLRGNFGQPLGQNWLGVADIAVQSIFLAFGVVIVGLRLWSRRLQRHSLQGNDWLVVGATILVTGRYAVELMLILHCGMGFHAVEVEKIRGSEVLIRFEKLTYAGDLLWITTIVSIQLSILHYCLRRFSIRIVVFSAYVMMGLCSALAIASLLATALICTPPRKAWLENIEGHCGNQKALHIGCAVSGIVLNLFILLVPLPAIWHMRLSRPRQIALGFIFFLGISIIVISGIRTKLEWDLVLEDAIYSSARVSLLSCTIPMIGVIAACLPVLSPAIERLFRTTMFSTPDDQGPESILPGYWKSTVPSGTQMEEPEIPLVSVAQAPMTKKWSELALGQIKITSDWSIHSARNSARLEKDSIRRG